MPSTLNFPATEIDIFIGFQNGAYRAEDAGGSPANQVECIGGSRGSQTVPTDVLWRIHNRTGHAIVIKLENFERDSDLRCPVVGGDITACMFESGSVAADETQQVQTVLNFAADVQRYTYDLVVRNAQTGDGNIVDPELQIDN